MENEIFKIEDGVLTECLYKEVTSVTIPDGITKIGKSAFEGCYSFKEVTIPDSVKSIGESAFENCKNLTSISIPDGVTIINDFTFSGCDNLKSVILPDSIATIGKGAFENCYNLEEINIPDDVEIRDIAFCGCDNLKNPNFLRFLATSRKYCIGSHMCRENEHETLLANVDTTIFSGNILIEDKEYVQKILGKTNLKEINDAFYGCINLELDKNKEKR